jgi:hypothetical protein
MYFSVSYIYVSFIIRIILNTTPQSYWLRCLIFFFFFFKKFDEHCHVSSVR